MKGRMMNNLLKETVYDIDLSGHRPEDIIFIGSLETGHSCSWEEFEKLADFEYDAGFGCQEIASDLIVAFDDGSHMWRHEYDGSEYWQYTKPIEVPDHNDIKPIKSLGGRLTAWSTLAEIEEEKDDE